MSIVMEEKEQHNVPLSPFDQTIPRLYVHKMFCFPFTDAERQAETVERLEQALAATILKWPFIAGKVSPSPENEHEVQLLYEEPEIGGIGEHVLVVRNLAAPEYPWSYEQLADAGMPPSAMNKDIFSTVPEWPAHEETHPALAIQANFIEGGLILCFAFHHAVADGGSFITFLKSFAEATRNPTRRDSATAMSVEPRVTYTAPRLCTQVLPLDSFPEYDYKSVSTHHDAYREITTRILVFSADRIAKLEADIRDELKKNPEGPSFVSNIACLSSLIWVAVMRARHNRLPPFETTKIGIAVNARSCMKPKLADDYFGNLVVHTNATAKVYELLDTQECGSGGLAPMSITTLALGASRMREATQSVTPDYLEQRLRTFSSLHDPTETSRLYAAAMDTAHTGLDFSSWRDQGADIEFGLPGAGTSTVDFWRKAWSPNEGAYNILPRKGGSKGPANWEISLGLSKRDMAIVCSNEELGAWCSKIIE
jgi:trichothecene 3-O-acetyltransferase